MLDIVLFLSQLTDWELGGIQPFHRGRPPEVADADVHPWGIAGSVSSPVVH